jgi:hypothetical protein
MHGTFEGYPSKSLTRTDKVLFRVCAPLNGTIGGYLRSYGYKIGKPFRARMIFWENDQRKVIGSDKFNKHHGRLDCTTFRCRYNNEICWFYGLTILIGCCFNAQSKQGICLGNK